MPMKEKDVRDLAESYGRRTIGDCRVIVGLCCIRYLIGLIHWVQDFLGRIGQEPSIEGINREVQFRAALDEAFYHADVRKIKKDQQTPSVRRLIPANIRTSANGPNGNLRS
jgi:hypothetical protein